MREKRLYRSAAGILFLAAALSAAGCAGSEPSAAPQSSTPASTPAAGTEPAAAASTASPPPAPSVTNTEKQASAANAVQQAAANDPKAPAGSPGKTKKTFDSYSVEKPLLMGVAIGDSKEKTVQLHGNPYGTYVMEDGDDPITVAEYLGFLVGFNKKQQAEFVEITEDDVDPGLNGLHLGQEIEAAYTALGKPDANTDYVLTYRTKETVLKLDVDPKTKSIQSIKMFRRTE